MAAAAAATCPEGEGLVAGVVAFGGLDGWPNRLTASV